MPHGHRTGCCTGLAVASDWTDAVLFALISGFAVSVASSATRLWLRGLAIVVFVVTAASAVLLAAGASMLEVAAPVALPALVVSIVVDDVRHRDLDQRGRRAHARPRFR